MLLRPMHSKVHVWSSAQLRKQICVSFENKSWQFSGSFAIDRVGILPIRIDAAKKKKLSATMDKKNQKLNQKKRDTTQVHREGDDLDKEDDRDDDEKLLLEDVDEGAMSFAILLVEVLRNGNGMYQVEFRDEKMDTPMFRICNLLDIPV